MDGSSGRIQCREHGTPAEAVEDYASCVGIRTIIWPRDELDMVTQNKNREESNTEPASGPESAASQPGKLDANAIRTPSAAAEVEETVHNSVLVHANTVVAHFEDPVVAFLDQSNGVLCRGGVLDRVSWFLTSARACRPERVVSARLWV